VDIHELGSVRGKVELMNVLCPSDGWHTDILAEQLNQAATDFQTAVEHAKESLSH
jgi:hypothetical protein